MKHELRDKMIYAEYYSQFRPTYAALGRKYQISRERVRQIIAKLNNNAKLIGVVK